MEEVRESAVSIEGTIGDTAPQKTPTEAPDQGPEEPVETPPEEPTEDVSEDAKTSETEEVEEKTVPYKRFKEKVDEAKVYKEMLAARGPEQQQNVTQVQNTGAEPQTPLKEGDDISEALKIIDQRVAAGTSKVQQQMESRLELQQVMNANADFGQYKDDIKNIITTNPNLGWEQAYKLAKFDSVQTESLTRGKQEAYEKISEKERAAASPTKKAPVRAMPTGEVNPLAKDPKTGKYLHSLDELEESLPRHESRS